MRIRKIFKHTINTKLSSFLVQGEFLRCQVPCMLHFTVVHQFSVRFVDFFCFALR